MKKMILLLWAGILMTAAVTAQSGPGTYTVYDTYYGWEVPYKDMMQDLNKANIVIIGEEHNDAVAHSFQLDVLKSLYDSKGDNVFFSMEMFERDVQPVMDEYLYGWISEKNFIKESRAWANYKDYQPMVEFCKENTIPIICANTPARYVNMVTRHGLRELDKLPNKTKKAYLPSFPIDTLKGRYADKFWGLMGGMEGNHQMRFLYQSQNLWDATMAHSIIEVLDYNPRQTVLHINGRFHSDEYLGVTARLKKKYKRGGEVITITCIPEDVYNAEEHKGIADYIILTGKK